MYAATGVCLRCFLPGAISFTRLGLMVFKGWPRWLNEIGQSHERTWVQRNTARKTYNNIIISAWFPQRTAAIDFAPGGIMLLSLLLVFAAAVVAVRPAGHCMRTHM